MDERRRVEELMHRHGHRIAYVLDGAGNFERSSALQTIINFSDCTASYSDAEIKRLAATIKKS